MEAHKWVSGSVIKRRVISLCAFVFTAVKKGILRMNTTTIELFRQMSKQPVLLEKLQKALRKMDGGSHADIVAGLRAWLEGQRPVEMGTELHLEDLDPEYLLHLVKLVKRDFSHQDLSGLDLSELVLDGANFFSALLINTRLHGASLKAANFEHAELSRADLTRANLQAVTANLAVFDRACFAQANLQGGSFLHANFHSAQMERADLSRANLTGSTFNGADLTSIRAYQTIAKWVTFTEARLGRTNWREAILTGAQFHDADLSAIHLEHGSLDRATFYRTCMVQAHLDWANCSAASFSQANLEGARLQGANLNSAVFLYTNLQRGNLQDASTAGTLFYQTTFSPETIIAPNSHALIAALLETTAETFEQRCFAAGIRSSYAYCWKDFTDELRERPDLIPWVEETLTPYASLSRNIRVAKERLGQQK
jgi:uncharacterized protein YjbI with pentapeptide repeats